jgi:hypothetical protein
VQRAREGEGKLNRARLTLGFVLAALLAATLFVRGQPRKEPTSDPINATTIRKKVLCGYQGWFRAPGDGTRAGWRHWSHPRDLGPATISVEMWPDMTEFSKEEKFPAPGFTHPDGTQAYLFSSAQPKTVQRHFEWMAKYGIDGVLVQRFVIGLDDPGLGSGNLRSARGPAARALAGRRRASAIVLNAARAAANRTGRVFAVEYDMSGTPTDRLYERLLSDWKFLVDDMKITADPRYLHHDGKPVLAIFGFFSERFGASLANSIIDFFKNDPKYRACLIGGCQWWWRTEKDPDWAKAFRRFDVISPWNVGNYTKEGGRACAATGSWGADVQEARHAGMLYMPVIYPGSRWDNLKQKRDVSIPRLGGDFFWRQFVTAADLGIDLAKVAMFDEVDEGTAIFKVTNTPPIQGRFLTFEDKPSDWYLRLTGEGTKMLRKERPASKTIPIQP